MNVDTLHTQLDFQLAKSGEDFEYFCSLARQYKYARSEHDVVATLFKFARHIWIARVKTETGWLKCGVIYLQYFPEWDRWCLDAYRDDLLLQIVNPRGDFSFRAGQMVVDWFCFNHPGKDLWTMHDTRNRAATIVCKRLNFVTGQIVKTDSGEFIILQRRAC